jgi:hypothetical protein
LWFNFLFARDPSGVAASREDHFLKADLNGTDFLEAVCHLLPKMFTFATSLVEKLRRFVWPHLQLTLPGYVRESR